MRICLVSYEFPPGGGGEASYVSSLAKSLGGLGHEVLVITPQPPGDTAGEDTFRIIPTHPRHTLIREMEFLSEAERTISYLSEKGLIDLVHVTFDYPTFFFRLRRRGVPCVATVHHLHLAEALSMLRYEKSAPLKVAQMLRAMTLTALEGRLVRQCSSVIAVSRFTAETVRRYLGVPPNSVRIVRNGIDAAEFEGGDPERFRDEFPTLGEKTVLFVGRLERSKGLHYLIPAFSRLLSRVPDATMAIVGRGFDHDYLRGLKRSAASEGVSDKVTFTGRIPRDLLPHAYAASTLVALPSLMEGFGISLLESMASGKPCVATRVGAIPELLRHGETGLLVEPANPQELGDAMATLICDSGLARRMGDRALDVVKREFSLERMTGDTLRIYHETVRSPATQR